MASRGPGGRIAALGAHLSPAGVGAEPEWSPAVAAAIREATAAHARWGAAWDLCSSDPVASAQQQTEQMHFPHVRLAQGRDGTHGFVTTPTAADFRNGFSAPPEAEGFARTVQTNTRIIQASETKVHLAFGSSRRHADGTEYTYFEAT